MSNAVASQDEVSNAELADRDNDNYGQLAAVIQRRRCRKTRVQAAVYMYLTRTRLLANSGVARYPANC